MEVQGRNFKEGNSELERFPREFQCWTFRFGRPGLDMFRVGGDGRSRLDVFGVHGSTFGVGSALV